MDYSPIINGKNILITGGTGSFGRQLVKEISGLSPKNVVIYSRDEDKQYSMKQDLSDEKISKRISFVIGDIRDYDSVNKAVKGQDIVIHLAALIGIPYSYASPIAYLKTNVEGTYNVFRAQDQTKSIKL